MADNNNILTFGVNTNADNLNSYFDNSLSGIQMTNSLEIDELLSSNEMFKTEDSSPELQRSYSDLDLEHTGMKFESDTDLSYHSSESSEFESHDESHDHDELLGQKKYRQPASLRGTNITVGPWKLTDPSKPNEGPDAFTFEVKFLFGRRKIKYDFFQTSTKKSLIIDFDFTSISNLKLLIKERLLIFQLSEPPSFSSKEKGKCNKIPDFTQGNASKHQRHVIELAPAANTEEQFEKLLQCDRRLRQLSEVALLPLDSTFTNVETVVLPTSFCDWDKENGAVVYCAECNANYCEDCDDVLHRHATRKAHKRIPINSFSKPKKNKKRKKNDRCRCGTGATKGTLGDPCTGNRCPCFSNGKNCSSCGCKNCNNPFKKNKLTGHSSMTDLLSKDLPVVTPVANAPVQL